MTKQKKLAEAEEFNTPLEILLSFLRVPHKIYRSIYISIIERRLSTTPLIQSEESIAYIAQQVGVEPALMGEKIENMIRMKWIQLEQVGNRDVNQIFVLSPIWRFKPGMDKDKFAIALRTYKAGIVEDREQQMSTVEVYKLMGEICPHTLTKVNGEVCEMGMWSECETCSARKDVKENDN